MSSNKDYSKGMAKNLARVLNVGERISNNFMKLIVKAILHDVAMESLDKGPLNTIKINIPYICTALLKAKRDEDGNIIGYKVYKVVGNHDFMSLLEDAAENSESPLLKEEEKKLAEAIRKKYDSLL